MTLDLVAASLRADAADIHSFVEVLADKLSLAFPDLVQVERDRGFGRRRKPVRKIVLAFPDERYELAHDGATSTCLRSTVVRGIALKTDVLSLDDWIDRVSRSVTAQAELTQQGRAALERLLL